MSSPLFILRRTVLASLLLAPGVAAQSVSFLPRVDYDLSDPHPIQSATADFDKDGRPDIVVTCEGLGGGKFEVLWGDSGADFGSSTTVSRPGAWSLAVGDFDGDTWPDIAVGIKGFAQQYVGIYLNDHQRGFPNVGHVYTLATSVVGITTGDYDGDGNIDLATGCETGGSSVDWFRGHGDGTFSSFQSVPYSNGLTGRRILSADVDDDGDLELILLHDAGVLVLMNTQNPNDWFHSATTPFPFAGDVTCGAAADFDADGTPDLAIVASTGAVSVWRGAGDGSFTLLSGPFPSTVAPEELRTGDLNGDGELDVVLFGAGGFELFFGTQGGGSSATAQAETSGVTPTTGVVGDWDVDGRQDVAAACHNGGQDAYVSVHLQEAFPPAVVYCTPKVNSQGCFPSIASSGQAQLSGTASFDISASAVINNQYGMLFYGHQRASVPFQGGTLCVGGSLSRTPVQFSGGTSGAVNCSGTYHYDFNARIRSGADASLVPGATVNAQYWSRDPAAPFPTGLTDALEFVIAP